MTMNAACLEENLPHLDKQLGTLDVSNQGYRVLDSHSSCNVTFGDCWCVAMLAQRKVNHETDLLLRKIVGYVFI